MLTMDPVMDPALMRSFDAGAMNAHLLVLGAAGTGKTSFVASRVSRDVFSGIGCMVLSTDGGYAELARRWSRPTLVPGQGLGVLDPFDFRGVVDTDELVGRAREITCVLEYLLPVLPEAGGARADALVPAFLRAVLDGHWDIDAGSSTLSSMAAYLDGLGPRARPLRDGLAGLLAGPMGRYLGTVSGDHTVPPRGLTLVDLGALPVAERPLAAFCWMLRAWRVVSAGNRPYVLVMDELPAGLLDGAPLGAHLLSMVKRARPYGLGLVIVASDVPGLLDACCSPDYWTGLSLLQNCGGKLLFRPDAADLDRVVDAFALDPRQGLRLGGCGAGEGLYLDVRLDGRYVAAAAPFRTALRSF